MHREDESPFFKLPLELRDQIYGILLEDGNRLSKTRDFEKSPCPIGACSQSLPTTFRTYILLTHVNRQMASDVKGIFAHMYGDRVSMPFWDLHKLHTALDVIAIDKDPEGLRNARFTLRCPVRRDGLPAAKERLIQDLRLRSKGGGVHPLQTVTDHNAHVPCPCIDMKSADIEWRLTLYSPLSGSLLLWSWRKWCKQPLGIRPEEPRLQQWLVLEGRMSDLLDL